MTTLSPVGVPRTASEAPSATLCVEWPLALDGPAAIVIAFDGPSVAASLVTLTGTAALASGQCQSTVDGDLRHFDAPGVATVTIRRLVEGGFELLYARTPLSDAVGARGGCVERPRLINR